MFRVSGWPHASAFRTHSLTTGRGLMAPCRKATDGCNTPEALSPSRAVLTSIRAVARILIIEDDDRIRGALRLMLENEGFDVDAGASAEEGLELFARQVPALAIVDVMLPGASGFEACDAMRAQSDLPIIIVSARDDTADVVRGLESGADDYVTKPFIPRELLARVKAHLRRRPSTNAPFTVGNIRVSRRGQRDGCRRQRHPPHRN